MLKIWGRNNSSNVQKVVWLCEELALPFERIDLGGAFGGTGTPEYLALNPNGRIPTLDDDGFVLWESNAILRYLAGKYGSEAMWPHDARQRARCDRWLDWQQTTLAADFVSIVFALLRTPPMREIGCHRRRHGAPGYGAENIRCPIGRPRLHHWRYLEHRRHSDRHLDLSMVLVRTGGPRSTQHRRLVRPPTSARRLPQIGDGETRLGQTFEI